MVLSDILEGAAIGAAVYAVGRRDGKRIAQRTADSVVNTSSLDEYVEKYADAHGIYLRDHAFAEALRRIADRYDDPYYRG